MKRAIIQSLLLCVTLCESQFPLVITTWPFISANDRAWETLHKGGSYIDAVESGLRQCEIEQCDGTVGYGGSPDENGETTLDALIMDGVTMNVGAVAGLRRIKEAIRTARLVLDHTSHSLLVGDQATDFAKMMGFKEEQLQTPESKRKWLEWRRRSCQPNYWVDTVPDNHLSCGPYKPTRLKNNITLDHVFEGHDTIGIVVVDNANKISAGTSTNGKLHKIPGRVGDSPIPGAGAFADIEAGGCSATGDGDIMIRFLPCYFVVEQMRNGISPTVACENAIRRMAQRYSNFRGALIAANMNGEYGAANYGQNFTYVVRNPALGKSTLINVKPLEIS